MEQKQIIDLIQQAQKKQLDTFDVNYSGILQNVEIEKLVRPAYSSRVVIDSKLQSLIESLNSYGFLGGIFISEYNYNVIDGWQRMRLWSEMGETTIPCYILDCTIKQEKELHLKLNTQSATFNFDDFGLNFQGLSLIEDFGFSEEDLRPVKSLVPTTKEKKAKALPEGLTKLTTLIKTDLYAKLSEYKVKLGYENMGDVIESLIEKICE